MAKRKSPKIEWCDLTLMSSPIPYSLCTSEKAFQDTVKNIDYPEKWLSCGAYATTHCFTSTDSGDQVIIVAIDPEKSEDLEAAYAFLCHEAVHVWQFIRESLGEDAPGKEQEAYSVQHIAYNLMTAYKRQVL